MNLPEFEQHGAKTPLDRILELRNQPPRAARLAILRILAEEIDKGQMSGDISPENILISGDLSAPDISIAFKNTETKFVPEEELGTDGRIPEAARYLPPERILGTATDVRSHEFSLAVIACEFVCGRKPFDAPDLPQLFYRVCTDKPIPNPQLSREVTSVLDKALAKDREQRFRDCKSFVEALVTSLNGALNGAPNGAVNIIESASPLVGAVTAVAPPAPAKVAATGLSTTRLRRRYGDEEPAAQPGRSRIGQFALLAALCLAVLGVVVFFLRYQPKPNLPVQVLDTNAGPATPPPAGDQITPPKKAPAPPRQTRHVATPAARPLQNPPANPLTSSVEFLTDPPSAQIVVDGNPGKTCTTPCTLL